MFIFEGLESIYRVHYKILVQKVTFDFKISEEDTGASFFQYYIEYFPKSLRNLTTKNETEKEILEISF